MTPSAMLGLQSPCNTVFMAEIHDTVASGIDIHAYLEVTFLSFGLKDSCFWPEQITSWINAKYHR